MAFELNGEQVCKAKWASWFKDGGWSVTDLTQKKSGELQIPALLNKIRPSVKDDEALSIVKRELLTYLSNLNFPYDGECHRGRFMFCFDFKFIGNSKHGIFANKADYDKYWSWRKPWFYLLFYIADRDKRYMHQVRDPTEYPLVLDGAYYDVTRNCLEAKDYNVPISFPIPTADMSELESLALIFAANRWCDNGCKDNVAITPDDYAEARPLLNKSHPLILKVLRKSVKALSVAT